MCSFGTIDPSASHSVGILRGLNGSAYCAQCTELGTVWHSHDCPRSCIPLAQLLKVPAHQPVEGIALHNEQFHSVLQKAAR